MMMGLICVHFDAVANLPSLFLRRIWKGVLFTSFVGWGVVLHRRGFLFAQITIHNFLMTVENIAWRDAIVGGGDDLILVFVSFAFVTLEMKIA